MTSAVESAYVGEEALAAALAAQDDRLSNCVHCGFCLPACPTYVRLGDEADSPRGRLHLMRAVVEGRLDPGAEAFQTHIDRCLGCRACETVCPSGVEYGFLLERAREAATRVRQAPLLARALLAMIRTRRVLQIAMGGGQILRGTGIAALVAGNAPSWRWLRTPRFSMAMLAASRPWRGPRAGLDRSQPAPADSGPMSETASGPPRGRVGVLAGCVQRHLFARVNAATDRVLSANGWDVVHIEDQGCCGALHAHAGQLAQARELARKNIRAFRVAGVDHVVGNAAGCGATMREYHQLMEGGEAEAIDDARWFAERVRDISEVLTSIGGPALRQGGPLPIRVAYDPPCHLLHGQRVSSPPLDLLRSIPGVDLVLVPKGDECCGGAGIYGITHPDLGGQIGGDKVDAILSTGAELLATGNPGCAMQIGAGLQLRRSSVQVVHPIELLDESYRRGGVYDE